MVMRADENHSLTLAMLKRTWHFGVVEMGFNLESEHCFREQRALEPGLSKTCYSFLSSQERTSCCRQFVSISCGVCFVHAILLAGAAAVMGMCL